MALENHVTGRDRGQVLAFYAVLLPVILLPLTAYAVDAAFVSSRVAGLQAATSQAAEAAAQQVDVAALRARSVLVVDQLSARVVAVSAMRDSEPWATVDSVAVAGSSVTILAHELVALPFDFLPSRTIVIHAHATARLVGGYDRPSSRLPLSTNIF
ncbi:MAG TPA: hypothetical protein VHW94_00995 [Candidatus Dormibacteraeota bacterium]|nr:hypothetical protein [Candidatus Dormibacteraeota bacterium]